MWPTVGGVLAKLCASALLLAPVAVQSFELDPLDKESVKQGAFITAHGLMKNYPGNKTGGIPGLFGDPYYWWEAGAAFGGLVDYWFYTGDEGLVPVTMEAMVHQVGPYQDYMPPNQSKSLGNDDQGFWGLAAMSAAEKKFPDPPEGQPQWLALAQAVFNSQALRWDNKTCNGGLRWQIYSFNNGYDYKNTISNGVFFQLGARLARYTNNDTYALWAETTYDWTQAIGLISPEYKFFDGSDSLLNCSELNHIQWSYNAGMYLAGAAYMYNYTESNVWKERVQGILDQISVFFRKGDGDGPKDVMVEVACEPYNKCNIDQRSFKAYLSRFLALTVKMAPFTRDQIMPKLQESARWAAKTCSGGDDGVTCTMRWETGVFDPAWTGLGEQMCALEIIQSNLIEHVPPPVTEKDGTSKGDPSAGTGGDREIENINLSPTTSGDRVGAGFLTTFILIGFLGGAYWMVV